MYFFLMRLLHQYSFDTLLYLDYLQRLYYIYYHSLYYLSLDSRHYNPIRLLFHYYMLHLLDSNYHYLLFFYIITKIGYCPLYYIIAFVLLITSITSINYTPPPGSHLLFLELGGYFLFFCFLYIFLFSFLSSYFISLL